MKNVPNPHEIKKISDAWHCSRIEAEKKLISGEIGWDEYMFMNIGFELKLKSLGATF